MFKFRDSIDSDIQELEEMYNQTLTNKSVHNIFKSAYKHMYEPILHKIHLNDSFFNKLKTSKYMNRLNKLKDGYNSIVNQKKETISGFYRVTLRLNADDTTTYLENGVPTAYNTVEYFESIEDDLPMNKLGQLSAMYESYSVWYKFLFKDDISITTKDAFHGQLLVYKIDTTIDFPKIEKRLGENV
jgi:hypothetical protein